MTTLESQQVKEAKDAIIRLINHCEQITQAGLFLESEILESQQKAIQILRENMPYLNRMDIFLRYVHTYRREIKAINYSASWAFANARHQVSEILKAADLLSRNWRQAEKRYNFQYKPARHHASK